MESPETRRRIMQAVKSKDTAPEMLVRRLLHSRGYRYRLHRKDLPGCPDLVFVSRCKLIFVHGCFWHGHNCERGARIPKSNVEYWSAKIERNRARDRSAVIALSDAGWSVLVIWECNLRRTDTLIQKLLRFLNQPFGGFSNPALAE